MAALVIDLELFHAPAFEFENRWSNDMAKKVAELMVDVLLEAGVKRVYGVSGDSLNGFTDAIRSQEQLQWIHLRHEEVAAFAAGAEAHLTWQLSSDQRPLRLSPEPGSSARDCCTNSEW